MRLQVVKNLPLTPGMQEVVLAAPQLATLSYHPGQDLMLVLARTGDQQVRRRYTIRGIDTASSQVTLGIVRHSGGPGERWVAAARPGDQVEGAGPRGKVFVVEDAGWHLFAGDFAALPAFFAMAGSLPAGTSATVLLEIPGQGDEQKLSTAADVQLEWLHADGRPAGDPRALVGAVAKVPLPPGPGHVYLVGEAKAVLAMRETLTARGLPPDRVSAKAYWGRGRANAPHGEPR